MNIFQQFKKSKKISYKTDFVKVYDLVTDDRKYSIIIMKKFANKHSIIHCKNDTIILEQKPLIPGLAFRQAGEMTPIFKFSLESNIINIFVIKGYPNNIIGLDDGIFRSYKHFNDKYVNVLTNNNFKKI